MDSDRLTQLRSVSLIETMKRLGYKPYHQKGDYAEYRFGDRGERKVAVTDNRAFDGSGAGIFHGWKDDAGGVGAIDLVSYIEGCTTREAIRKLAEMYGTNPVSHPTRNIPFKPLRLQEMPPQELSEDKIQQAKNYLVKGRGLEEKTINDFINSGRIQIVKSKPITRADGSMYTLANIAFVLRDEKENLTGAIIRGIGGQNAFKQNLLMQDSPTSTFHFGCPLAKAKKVIVFESPIDALSYVQLKGGEKYDTHYCVYGGARLNQASKLTLSPDVKMIIALDNDEAGRKMATKLQEKFPNAKLEFPKNKDFNLDLIQSKRVGYENGFSA